MHVTLSFHLKILILLLRKFTSSLNCLDCPQLSNIFRRPHISNTFISCTFNFVWNDARTKVDGRSKKRMLPQREIRKRNFFVCCQIVSNCAIRARGDLRRLIDAIRAASANARSFYLDPGCKTTLPKTTTTRNLSENRSEGSTFNSKQNKIVSRNIVTYKHPRTFTVCSFQDG